MLVHEQLKIFQLRLPLPFRLDHINSYVVQGRGGWWIIDTGLNTKLTRSAWQQFMNEHGISGQEIKGIYLTHAHPDHFGAAGWLQQLSGAPVYASRVEADTIKRIWQSGVPLSRQVASESFFRNGMPAGLIPQVNKEMDWLIPRTIPHPEITVIEASEQVQLGDYTYEVIFTPGHADGHICYFNHDQGILLSGDHLLPKISSNISLWPDGAPDPLGNYLNSLASLRRLHCNLVLPAHGKPFANMVGRVTELETHHAMRLELIKDCVGEDSSAFEVCQQVFSKDLGMNELRFALTETLAHLVHLVYKKELQLNTRGLINTFSRIYNKGPLKQAVGTVQLAANQKGGDTFVD